MHQHYYDRRINARDRMRSHEGVILLVGLLVGSLLAVEAPLLVSVAVFTILVLMASIEHIAPRRDHSDDESNDRRGR